MFPQKENNPPVLTEKDLNSKRKEKPAMCDKDNCCGNCEKETPPPVKRGRGRPKGSKNKAKVAQEETPNTPETE